eukprot:GHUV01019301.1.p1 GENE.GHUV01019301.1~~GHUV01019301.1.p1  ORF type:complete len:732 (+),score=248.43 GHUV01019301.1:153-2348(+)
MRDLCVCHQQVMKPTQSSHQRLRLGDSNLLVAVDTNTQRLLKYQELDGPIAAAAGMSSSTAGQQQQHSHHHHHRRGKGAQHWKLDASFWSERDCVQVRYDLLDTHIAICSPEVLMMFSDNFDYQTLKKDFVVGTLSEEELGKKIYLYVLQGEYAARIHNLRSYDAVSRDLLARWAFPFSPDTNVFYKAGPWGPSSYRYARGHKYLESVTSCSRSSHLGPSLAIGAGTAIGDGAVISNCVIGRGCNIGKNCRLSGSYLQDGVVLGDNVTANHALMCEGVVVGANATIQAGVVLSYGVVIAPRHTVPAHSIISLCKHLKSGVSLSDDELEYATAGRTSSSSGRAAAGVRRQRTTSGTGSRRARRSSAAADSSDNSSSSSSDSSSDDETTTSSLDFADAAGKSMEKPSSLALRAAQVLGGGDKDQRAQIAGQVSELGFAVHLVGEGGAGYEWPVSDQYSPLLYSIAPPPMRLIEHAYDSDTEGDSGGGGASDDGTTADTHQQAEGATKSRGSASKASALDPETVFMQEVGETFLRCVKERFAETNAVIELNGLKIAEDRTFADCARYIFTALLQLCLPCPSWVSPEYRSLFPSEAPDSSSKDGKLALLGRFKKQLAEWGNLLRRFLRSEDDQVELLLTLEEFCGEEGVFEQPEAADATSSAAAGGAVFAPLFANLLQLLYDGEVVEEAAITNWAAEKEHADESEKVFLQKSAAFLEWLKTAEDESSEEDEDSDE